MSQLTIAERVLAAAILSMTWAELDADMLMQEVARLEAAAIRQAKADVSDPRD